MPSAVKPEYGPALPELVGRRVRALPRAARLAVLALAALAVVALLAAAVGRHRSGGTNYVQRTPIAFNFVHPATLRRVPAQGSELVRLEQRRSGRFIQSFAVSSLALGAYAGGIEGALPRIAERIAAQARARYARFSSPLEGRTRVNDAPGYAIAFSARRDGRDLFGRLVLLPEPVDASAAVPRPHRAVLIEMLATHAAGGIADPAEVGAAGSLKRTFRSFRFGTRRP